MSEQRQNPDALPLIHLNRARPRLRRPVPKSVAVFGVLNLLIAALQLIVTGLLVMPLLTAQHASNPALATLREDRFLYGFLVATTVVGVVLILMLAIAGIGLLQSQSWGRQLSVIYGTLEIVATFISLLTVYLYLFEPLIEAVSVQGSDSDKDIVRRAAFEVLLSALGSLIYPVILLAFMTRCRIVEALYDASH